MDSTHSDHMNPFLPTPLPSSPSSQVLQSLLHEPSMVNLGGNRRRRSVTEDEFEADEDEFGSLCRRSEKKRRLTPTQVQFLERSFDVDNKLEPERKIQLAKELGLQPRQVAIWFQNRRARFKTKQLEKDYDALKSRFDSLESDFNLLLKEKDLLQNEVSLLTAKLKKKETITSDPSNHTEEPTAVVQVVAGATTLLPCKQEDLSSAKSDVFDSESPHCPETAHSNSTSQVYEPEPSDFSPDEDLTGTFMPMADYGFGKMEDGDFHGGSCSNLGLPGFEGQPSYWPWLY